MKNIPASGPVTKGIDIYSGDVMTDITKLKPAGYEYAFVKAFEYVADSSFASRWSLLKAHGIIRGAYDFFHPGKDALTQAKNFMVIVGKLDAEDLPCCLDFEVMDHLPAATVRNGALVWLEYVEKASGKIPMIYGSPYFLQDLALDLRFARYPLWIAQYGPSAPLVPAPWTGWKFWQTSDAGAVPGMSGHCDTDIFNGSLDDLKAFCLLQNVGQTGVIPIPAPTPQATPIYGDDNAFVKAFQQKMGLVPDGDPREKTYAALAALK